jgi:hypothetical protein
MRFCQSSFVVIAMLFVLSSVPLSAQHGTPPNPHELLNILRITTFRIRVPIDPANVWDIKILKPDELKSKGSQPLGLTRPTYLFSMREKESGVYEFTLPERSGAFSQGDFELCKETSCEGQYGVKWLKQPAYSADGNQCVLAEFSNLSDAKPSAFIALVRARSRP